MLESHACRRATTLARSSRAAFSSEKDQRWRATYSLVPDADAAESAIGCDPALGVDPLGIVAVDASRRLLTECQLAGREGFRKGLPRLVELDMLPEKRDITVSFAEMREAWIRGWDEAKSAPDSASRVAESPR